MKCNHDTTNHPLLSFFSWETGQPVAARRQLDADETGPAMELVFQETDSGGPVLVYGTSYGDIVGWDLRMKGDAFRLDNDIKEGAPFYFVRNWSLIDYRVVRVL